MPGWSPRGSAYSRSGSMIQLFRVFINSIVGRLFFGVLVLTFALLGVGYGVRDLVLRGLQSNDAASVGDTKISLQEFDRDFRRDMSNYQRQLGGAFSPSAAQKQEIAQQTLEQQVAEALYSDAADDHGIRIGDDLLRRKIEQEPAFAGLDKKFDRGHFQMQLESRGLSEAGFTVLLRRDLARQMLITPIAFTAVAPKGLVEDLYRYRNEQRAAQTLILPNAEVGNVPTPADADLQSYYQKHAVDFTLPEYRTFTVLALTPDLFMGEITPSEDDLHAAYEARKADYVVPEQRKIDQVVLSDKAAADAIVKAVQDGKTLADAAKAATGGKSQVVTLDFMPQDQFPPALAQPAFAAQKGAVSGPIESPLGWHLILVTDIRPGHAVSFDEAKPKLIDQLKRDGATDRLAEQIDKLGDKLLGGAPMDQVAAGINAVPVKIGPVDAKGNPPPGAAAAKQPTPDQAWIAASFQLGSGETSPFQEAKSGGYFAVRVDGIIPPALRPLAEVRNDVVAGWTAERRAALNAKRAEEIAGKARDGTPMTDLAAEAKAKMETTASMTRESAALEGGEAGPSPALVDALFQLAKIGDVTTVATNDGQIVARLIAIQAADPKGADLAALSRQLDRALQADALAQYRAALRTEYKVKINPKAVETVAGQ